MLNYFNHVFHTFWKTLYCLGEMFFKSRGNKKKGHMRAYDCKPQEAVGVVIELSDCARLSIECFLFALILIRLH